MKIKEKLIELHACQSAIDWVEDKTPEQAWRDCERGDWMLWVYKRLFPDNLRELTLAKGHCANTVRHLMKEERSLHAIDIAIAFGEGRVGRDELNAADAYAASDAADAAADAAYAAADAADAAADAYAAAHAASAAAHAAYYAASDAAYAAADAAADAAYARTKNQKITADICRKYLTETMKSSFEMYKYKSLK